MAEVTLRCIYRIRRSVTTLTGRSCASRKIIEAPVTKWQLPLLAGVVSTYYSFLSISIHRAFHSNGWDLGIIVQVIWNSAHGRWFEYSFRHISYLGDHWQPALLVFVPVLSLTGVSGLLILQALALVWAGLLVAHEGPIGGKAQRLAFSLAWMCSLGVVQAVSFDFHAEVISPLLMFSAWHFASRARYAWFGAFALALVLVKEDAALATIALCYLAVVCLGCRIWPLVVGGIAAVYGFVVTAFLMPHYRGSDLNPFAERYAYLGNSPPEALRTMVTRPDVVFEHLARVQTLETLVVLLGGTAFFVLLRPKLLPALALVTIPVMLSEQKAQSTLQLHYLLVPGAMAMLIALTNLQQPPRWLARWSAAAPLAMVAAAAVLWAWRSPLPPSFASDIERFRVDEHERVAAEMVKLVPADARVSAQSHFVPHLAERQFIFQFPRVLDAEYVLIDQWGPKPAEDLEAGFERCSAVLPRLGFDVVRSQDGITLWQKRRQAESAPEVPAWCSGQRPRDPPD